MVDRLWNPEYAKTLRRILDEESDKAGRKNRV